MVKNSWVDFTRTYAAERNITFKKALQSKDAKERYKQHKEKIKAEEQKQKENKDN
tara:strand:- start:66 stop:230 length:165 start_codon:yes stop_codon:yes gene_type:complete